MSDDTLMLTFPKEKTEEITLQGLPFIRVDTGMTIEDLIFALMKYDTSDKKRICVIRKIPNCKKCKWYVDGAQCEAWDQRGSSGICAVFEPREEEE